MKKIFTENPWLYHVVQITAIVAVITAFCRIIGVDAKSFALSGGEALGTLLLFAAVPVLYIVWRLARHFLATIIVPAYMRPMAEAEKRRLERMVPADCDEEEFNTFIRPHMKHCGASQNDGVWVFINPYTA